MDTEIQLSRARDRAWGASRVYRTTDGGQTWEETFRNDDEAAFYNCIDFAPGGRLGLGVSDPVDGKFRIIRTTDGGANWHVLPSAGMPDSTGEYNFSASGDCLTMTGRDVWFGSGGAQARVFQSTDNGMTGTAEDADLPAGEAAGVFAIDFSNPRQGQALGGDFADPATGTSSRSSDGHTWQSTGHLTHLGSPARRSHSLRLRSQKSTSTMPTVVSDELGAHRGDAREVGSASRRAPRSTPSGRR